MVSARPNAAFYFAPGNYQTSGDGIVGRTSATGGFLRGFIEHGGTDTYVIYADQAQVFEEFKAFVQSTGGDVGRVRALLPMTTGRLGEVGTLFRPGPDLGALAWRRRHYDQRGFSICGITHTVAETMAMQVIGNLLVAPVQPWDALVCTTECVKAAVERLLQGWADYLGQRFERQVALPFQLPVIPLGVDAERYAELGADTEARTDLRRQMGIEDDDIAFLYAGRLNHVEKANPVPMYLAAELASKDIGGRVHLIQAGQATNSDVENAFKTAATTFAPSVNHHFVDGRRDDLYDKVWAAADIFISLADNIQESFGLTPIEAMAAGLPVIVSDYDGYRESVRDGIDGITVPTVQPPPGTGVETAFLYDTGFTAYPAFTAATSQSTAVNVEAAAWAMVELASDPEQRQKMAEAGQTRARDIYDWRHVVQAHQDLWEELSAVRSGADEIALPSHDQPNPLAPDPFHMFMEHATGVISGDGEIRPTAAATPENLERLLSSDVAAPLAAVMLTPQATASLLQRLAEGDPLSVDTLIGEAEPDQRVPMHLTLGWMMKTGLVVIDGIAPDAAAAVEAPFGQSETWKRLTGG